MNDQKTSIRFMPEVNISCTLNLRYTDIELVKLHISRPLRDTEILLKLAIMDKLTRSVT